jgi:hypothetical protein
LTVPHNDLLIGDVETVAEKLVGEIRATHPVHMCFSFKVGATPHKAAMRSMELMMSEVRPRVERALGRPAMRGGVIRISGNFRIGVCLQSRCQL